MLGEFDWSYFQYSAASFVAYFVILKILVPPISNVLFFSYKNLSHKDRMEWDNRILSTIHGAFITFTCTYALLFDKSMWDDPVWADSYVVRMECAVFVGYAVGDIIFMLVVMETNKETIMYHIHHSAAVFSFVYAASRPVLPFFANYRLMAEFSTPFVNNRWFFDSCRVPRTSIIFVANGLIMTFTFLASRIVALPLFWIKVYNIYFTQDYYTLGYIYNIMLISCVALDVLNIIWARKMVIGAVKVLKNFAGHKDDNENHIEKSKYL